MSDFLQAVEVITKLLPQLKSFTGARRREYFKELVQPLFVSFEEVHDFYNRLILDTRRKVVKIGWGHEARMLLPIKQSPSLDQLVLLGRMKVVFSQKRKKEEYLRDSLRQDARQMLVSIHWPEERRLLIAVSNYFLGDEQLELGDFDYDYGVNELIRRGGDSCWDTPSLELYNCLLDLNEFGAIVKELDRARDVLNQRYMNVRHNFKAVQQAIISKT